MSAKVTWIGIIVGLLGLSLVAHGILIVAAVSDPGFALVPDYEEKAASWDSIQAEHWASERLDWTVDLATAPGVFPGTVDVTVQLRDAAGAPIEDANVIVRGFHIARGNRILETSLDPADDPGAYAGAMDIRRPGIWQLEVVAIKGTDRFAKTIRKSVAGPANVPTRAPTEVERP